MTEFDLEKFKAALTSKGDSLDGLDDLDEFELVEKGDWVSDYKDETRDNVYRHTPTGRLICVTDSRRGSYWSDYEYAEPYLQEVQSELVTVVRYVGVGATV